MYAFAFLCRWSIVENAWSLLIFSLSLVPGVSQFVPMETPNDSPANQANVIQGLTQDDLATIHRKSLKYFLYHHYTQYLIRNL